MIMCIVWLGVCIVVLCPSNRSSGSKGVPIVVQERCKKVARYGALGRALSKLGLGLALVAALGEATGEGRVLTASCGLGSQPKMDTAPPVGVVPDTTGIRLQTRSGTPSFDSEGQVRGRLEVKVGDEWATVPDGDGIAWMSSFQSGAEATVACRQLGVELGYTLVSANKVASSNTDDGSSSAPAYEVTCAGAEATLDSCTMFRLNNWASGRPDWDVGVSCTFLAPSDGCDECVAGKFSDTTSVAACMNCAAGSYSTVGAASCQQVRLGGSNV
jgi:hypothetical protein